MVTGVILGVDTPLVEGGRWLVLETNNPPGDVQGWDLVIDFSGHVDQPNRLSLIRYLHENREQLVREAAARIDALGQARCARSGKTVIEELQVHEGYSFWYVSGAFEKCIVRNPELGLYLKCLAMEQLMVRHRPRMLALEGLAELPRRAIGEFAETLGLSVERFPFDRRKLRGVFMSRLRAMARFAVMAAKSLQLIGCRDWPDVARGEDMKREALFVAYSPNIRPGQDSVYDPVYWKGLPEIVKETFNRVDWCHLYDASAGDSERQVTGRMGRMESVAGVPHRIFLLEQKLRPGLVVRALLLYLRLQWRLAGVERALRLHRPSFGLPPWPFLEVAWQRSVMGGTAASLSAQILLLEQLARASVRRRAYYLCEGMPWERTLLYFWRRHGGEPIYGYQHTTVKSCDMRLLSCLAFGVGHREWLHPDGILFNGPAAGQALQSLGFDVGKLHPVEALRFNYLLDMRASVQTRRIGENHSAVILVVLEGIESIDRFVLMLVKSAISNPAIAAGRHFVIKPHPSGKVSVTDALAEVESAAWSETRESIHIALSKADLVCTSINSSACVEVETLGKAQVLIWKPSELIRTPLNVTDWDRIVTSSSALVAALEHPALCDVAQNAAPVFFLDKSLPRWRSVLHQP